MENSVFDPEERIEAAKKENLEICVVCGHLLGHHVFEKTGWRCHGIGHDSLQCECFLRATRAEGNIAYYDLIKRQKEYENMGECEDDEPMKKPFEERTCVVCRFKNDMIEQRNMLLTRRGYKCQECWGKD
jgi:hypothetical protein